MNYKRLRKKIIKKGFYQNNKRGTSLAINDIKFNDKDNSQLVDGYLEELKHFLGLNSLPEKFQKWWKKDSELYEEYKKLYSDFDIIINNLKRGSRNTILANNKTCISFISFKIIKNKLFMEVIQRSGDLDLGVRYDHFQMKYLHKYAALLINKEIGKFTHKILNCHIYLNNLYRNNNFILN